MSSIGSIVTALGGGSGVDMVKLASDLAAAQFALRSDRLAAQGEQLAQQISTASSIKNSLALLASALGDRVRLGDLSSQPSVARSPEKRARRILMASTTVSVPLSSTSPRTKKTSAVEGLAMASEVIDDGRAAAFLDGLCARIT